MRHLLSENQRAPTSTGCIGSIDLTSEARHVSFVLNGSPAANEHRMSRSRVREKLRELSGARPG
jgi:hypothetical protein